MARIRTIKPSFFRHGELFDAEQESKLPLRVAYAGLWTIADREGRFKYKPRDIKAEMLPYDNLNMEEVLLALEARAFIQSYEVEGQKYAWIPAFKEHQHVNVREPVSTIPEPPKNKNARAKRVPKPPRNHEEGKGKEGKGREGESADADHPFEDFWKACPKKVGRGKAEEKYRIAVEAGAPPQVLLAAIQRYARSQDGKDSDYTAHPATWLHQKRWLDEDGGTPGATIHVLSDEVRQKELENLKKIGVI